VPRPPTSKPQSRPSSRRLSLAPKGSDDNVVLQQSTLEGNDLNSQSDIPDWDGTYLGDGKDAVIVCVRVRPDPNNQGATFGWQLDDTSITDIKGDRKPLFFERVWGPRVTNREVFQTAVSPLVQQVIGGFNATFFCYGQTGSGKTHTVYGSKDDPGVCPLTVHSLFNAVAANPDTLFLIRVSYMEIYNEELNDLLDRKKRKLLIRESKPGDFQVSDLTETVVTTVEEVFDCVRKGNDNRSVGVSNLNEHSSRSHSIFRLVVESATKVDAEERSAGNTVKHQLAGAVRVSELNMVDLAGSETLTYAFDNKQQKETKAINLSLTQLKTVITALSKKESFIPYRNSSLTKLLRKSLGGNAKTTLVCTMHPHSDHEKMSRNTLHFGDLAKKIVNKATVNEDVDDTSVMLKQYRIKIEQLESKLGEFERMNAQRLKIQRDYARLQQELEELRRREQEKLTMEHELAAFSHHLVNRPPTPTKLEIETVPSLSDEQMAELQSLLDKLQADNKGLEEQLRAQTTQRSRAEQEIAERQRDKLALEARLAQQTQQRQLAEQEIAERNKDKLLLEATLAQQTQQRRLAEEEVADRQRALQSAQAQALEQEKRLAALRKQKDELAAAERQAVDRLNAKLKEMEAGGYDRDVYLANMMNNYENIIDELRRENSELLSLREVVRCDAEERIQRMRQDYERTIAQLKSELRSQQELILGGFGASNLGDRSGFTSGVGSESPHSPGLNTEDRAKEREKLERHVAGQMVMRARKS
jgi:centromeric protein E